jgi:hypothetical protein
MSPIRPVRATIPGRSLRHYPGAAIPDVLFCWDFVSLGFCFFVILFCLDFILLGFYFIRSVSSWDFVLLGFYFVGTLFSWDYILLGFCFVGIGHELLLHHRHRKAYPVAARC